MSLEVKTLKTGSFTKLSSNFFSNFIKKKLLKVVLLFFKKTNYALSIISCYLHTSETTQYFGFSSSYHHPFMWNFSKVISHVEKCLHSRGKNITMLCWKRRITAAQMSVTHCFFTLILVKSLGLARALLLPTRFSSFGNLFFRKMLPTMPLSYQGNIKQTLTIRTTDEKNC